VPGSVDINRVTANYGTLAAAKGMPLMPIFRPFRRQHNTIRTRYATISGGDYNL